MIFARSAGSFSRKAMSLPGMTLSVSVSQRSSVDSSHVTDAVFHRVRVGKLRVLSGVPAINAAQRRPDFDFVERMAASASFFESLAAAAGSLAEAASNGCADNAGKNR